jgi:histidinol dehydrogenase
VVSEAGRRRTIEVFGQPLSPAEVAERICRDVKAEGMAAVLRYGKKLDGAELTAESIRVPVDQLAKAHRAANPQFLETVRRIRENILYFQWALLSRDVKVDRPEGVTLWQRYVPLGRVGICVPGGAAAYPSTVLMTAVPAIAAGVRELVVVAPPTELGAYNTHLLATCHELGIQEVYRVGGAQGVAALAYGVEGLRPVDKIVGPGNLFVALAKKYVYGQVDIDSIAGPSEIVLLADKSARAQFVAADLLAQAEHSPGASILITWSKALLEATREELTRQVAQLSRSALTLQSLEEFGALVLVRDHQEGCRITNEIAPEHLHIATDNAEQLLGEIYHAGAIFLGRDSPVALGDYVAGPSHVLPTGGTARWASGLTANDFLRGGSVIRYSHQALERAAPDIQVMADVEQLAAHRASIDIRLAKHVRPN